MWRLMIKIGVCSRERHRLVAGEIQARTFPGQTRPGAVQPPFAGNRATAVASRRRADRREPIATGREAAHRLEICRIRRQARRPVAPAIKCRIPKRGRFQIASTIAPAVNPSRAPRVPLNTIAIDPAATAIAPRSFHPDPAPSPPAPRQKKPHRAKIRRSSRRGPASKAAGRWP